MFLFDTIGIALFTTLGIQISQQFELSIIVCLILGVVSAVFGGVVRDVLTNEIPLIFRKEIYATACLVGGIVFILLQQTTLDKNLVVLLSILVVMLIRYVSIRRGWSLHIGKSQ